MRRHARGPCRYESIVGGKGQEGKRIDVEAMRLQAEPMEEAKTA